MKNSVITFFLTLYILILLQSFFINIYKKYTLEKTFAALFSTWWNMRYIRNKSDFCFTELPYKKRKWHATKQTIKMPIYSQCISTLFFLIYEWASWGSFPQRRWVVFFFTTSVRKLFFTSHGIGTYIAAQFSTVTQNFYILYTTYT